MHDMDRVRRFIITLIVATIILTSVAAFVTPSAGAGNVTKTAAVTSPTAWNGNASTAAVKTTPIVGAAGWHIQTADSGNFAGTSLQLTSSGWPAISYVNYSDHGSLKYTYKDASGWHNETADRDGGSIPSLQLTKTGWPAIAYNDGSAGHAQQLRYA